MKTIFMSREQHKKWTDALRSGDYRQGFGSLKVCSLANREHRYCCLGVLQQVLDGQCEGGDAGDAYLCELPTIKWLDEHSITFKNILGDKHNSPYLPALIFSADDANDLEISFADIADAIDRCVEVTD